MKWFIYWLLLLLEIETRRESGVKVDFQLKIHLPGGISDG